jgi:hypothetical protein
VNSRLDSVNKYRKSLIEFLSSTSSKAWIKREHFTMLEYWQALSLYKFCICPPGNGVQSPKITEAFLTDTVPITVRLPAYVDLKKMGFPILLVDEWSELSPSFLRDEYERVYQFVNWTSVNRLLEPEQIMRLVMTGT